MLLLEIPSPNNSGTGTSSSNIAVLNAHVYTMQSYNGQTQYRVVVTSCILPEKEVNLDNIDFFILTSSLNEVQDVISRTIYGDLKNDIYEQIQP